MPRRKKTSPKIKQHPVMSEIESELMQGEYGAKRTTPRTAARRSRTTVSRTTVKKAAGARRGAGRKATTAKKVGVRRARKASKTTARRGGRRR
jgi:hypothetical protein